MSVMCRTEGFFHPFLYLCSFYYYLVFVSQPGEVSLLVWGSGVSVVVASWNRASCHEKSGKAARSELPSGYPLDRLHRKVDWWEETFNFISPGKIPGLFLELLVADWIAGVIPVSVTDVEVPRPRRQSWFGWARGCGWCCWGCLQPCLTAACPPSLASP